MTSTAVNPSQMAPVWTGNTRLVSKFLSANKNIIGGHLWIGVILLGGGAWHILVTPKAWVVKILRIEADAILAYSLGGLAFMALVSCAFVGFNTTAFPVEFYGIDHQPPEVNFFCFDCTGRSSLAHLSPSDGKLGFGL